MTTLLFVVDLMKEHTGIAAMENSETQLNFDEEQMTTPDEIIQTQMESAIIKRTGQSNPFSDVLAAHLEKHEMIYLNNKEQLLQIVQKVKDNGKTVDIHNIITFDVKTLPQSKKHDFTDKKESNIAVRAKVPVKDGRSQNVSSFLILNCFRNLSKNQKR